MLNLTPGITVAGTALVGLGPSGSITLVNGSSRPLHLLLDVTGFTRAGPGRVGGSYRTVPPTRLLDTRGTTPIPAHGVRAVQVSRSAVDPGGAATAGMITVTAVDPVSPGFLTAYGNQPTPRATSTLNLIPGETVAASIIMSVGGDGVVDVYNGSDRPVDVLVDISGYFVDGYSVFTGTFVGINPTRVLDTRTDRAIPAGGTRVLGFAQVPWRASDVFATLTVVTPVAPGYLVLQPTGTASPATSALNLEPGRTTANLAATSLGDDGQVAVVNRSGRPAQVQLDLVGYIRS